MQNNPILITLLLLIASIWFIYLLFINVQQLEVASTTYPYWKIIIALPFSLLALYTSGITYFFILSETSNQQPEFSSTVAPYLKSQIIRYLPGKIWGVLYQTKKNQSEIPAHAIWEANITQFMQGNILTAIFVGSAFIYHWDTGGDALFAFVVLLLGFFILLYTRSIHMILRMISRLIPLKYHVANNLPNRKNTSFIAICFMLEWFFYFLSWVSLLYPLQTFSNIIILSIIYVAAWTIGFAILAMPGGILVRESAFITLGGLFGFDVGTLAFYAIVARVLFSLSDLIGALTAHVIFKNNPAVS